MITQFLISSNNKKMSIIDKIPVEVLKEQVSWDLGKIAQRTRSAEIRTLVLKVKGCLQGIDQLNNTRRTEKCLTASLLSMN